MSQSPSLTNPLIQIRLLLALFIIALALSGITAFPLLHELDLLCHILGVTTADATSPQHGLHWWLARVHTALTATATDYPFLAYGTDWLAFGHLVIALFFIGPFIDPVRNIWVIKAGLIACVGVIPLALICGPIRQIPLYWSLIDCSFGVIGLIPLWLVLKLTHKISQPLI